MNLPLKCLVLSLQIVWTHLLTGELDENGFILSTTGFQTLLSVRWVHPFADSEKKLSFLRKSFPNPFHFI